MKRKLRGIKRKGIQLDFNLYRVEVPIRGVARSHLSVIDLWPEAVEETIVFVHGYAGCAETWELQINRFAREYRVVVPDLRGHGQSDAPYTNYTMNELMDDLDNIVQTLKLPEKFILVGHSFGGSICVEYANRYPERLEKLVLIATTAEYPLPRIVNWALRLPTAFYRLWWKYRPRWNAEIHVMKRMLANNLRRWKGWDQLRSITTPTLVITGERDNYFPRRLFEEAAQQIPNAEIYDVGAAKHKVQLERYTAVNRVIERFINQDRIKDSWRAQTLTTRLIRDRPWLKSYAEDVPYTIPLPRQPLHKFLESAADWVPRRTALVFQGKSTNYQTLFRQVNRFAHALHGLGVRPGDRVMLVLPNTPQFVIAYYAILSLGAAVVLPNPDADANGIMREVNLARPRVLVTLRNYQPLGQLLKDQTSISAVIYAHIPEFVANHFGQQYLIDVDDETDELTLEDGYGMEDLIEAAAAIQLPLNIEVKPQDLAAIIFTSGSSDVPKGVYLSHANLVANTLQIRHWMPSLRYGKETFLGVLPLSHSYGLSATLNVPVSIGARVVLLPEYDLEQVLRHIKRYKPTIFPGVPSIYAAINHAPKVRRYNLGAIKACLSGAAPLPIEVREEFEKVTRGRLVEGYGLTECSAMTHSNPLVGTNRSGSFGIPLPNTDARIIDLETGEELPPGQVGELVIRGPQVMQGYLQPRDADQAENPTRSGWLHTGDIAIMDDAGYFKFVSRKRDTIRVGEFDVYPRDVEEVLYENNKVWEAAVVGVNDGARGQRIKAYVVPQPGTSLSKEQLIALCQRRLEDYAVPDEIEFRESLPKSFVGKVLHRRLVEE